MPKQDPLLRVDNLCIEVGATAVIRDLTLELVAGEMLGLVGESGCGKSLTALSLLGLLDEPLIRIVGGGIEFQGREIHTLKQTEMDSLRGCELSMIFQEPMTSLNPVFTIGKQIMESLFLHTRINKSDARIQAISMLSRVGIASPDTMLKRYPHQLSGGQRQRIMIAMALACNPKLLVADEPTTALDVTIQAQILELLKSLREENDMAVLFITHDLGLVRHYCDRVAVMYCGQIVEQAPTDQLFEDPQHPYTRALLKTIPSSNKPGAELPSIPGQVPAPSQLPNGCAFSTRCQFVSEVCLEENPELSNSTHQVRCWNTIKRHPE